MSKGSRSKAIDRRRGGFTLIEQAMVLVITGLMTSYLLQMNQFAANRDCYVLTKTQLYATREAVERFARQNDRLPMPAARNVGVESIYYGREALASAIDQASGVSWGALPFQALKLPTAYAGDCWGNKITYAVTTALTTSNIATGFRSQSVLGNIAIKSSTTNTMSPTGAYAIISHGEDGLGAVKVNYSGTSHGWCTGTAVAQMNCNISNGAMVGNALLNGAAGANYFDDIVMAADKPKTILSLSNVVCWGRNTSGKLGDATTTTRSAITAVHGAQSYMSLASGHDFNCGLTAAGEAWCWGDNTNGQLGDGTSGTTRPEPVKVTGSGADPLSFTALAAGYNHACGLNVMGDVYCWGANTYGQIGDSTSGVARTAPVKVAGGFTFTRIAAGNSRTCALTVANALYCWGENGSGGLGTTAGSKLTPTLVNAGPFISVSMHADGSTQCAITSAGAAYCWGIGSVGQLGNNSTTANSNSLVAVSGGLIFKTLAVGGTHVCGLTSAGAAYCWGLGSNGVAGNAAAAAAQKTPIAVVGGHVFSDIASGTDHTCGHEAGSLYCWGINSDYNLGDGGTSNASTPVKVVSTGASPYVMGAVSAGNYHACAIAPVDRAYCWNANTSGQMGDGTNVAKATPTKVSGSTIFTSIFRTGSFSCGLTAGNVPWCWGDNSNGTLGNGSNVASNVPVAVNGSFKFSKLASGDVLACGITTAGAAYCWGANGNGQLGVGNAISTKAPATRAGGNIYRDIAAAADHTCGLRDNGAVDCWGQQLNALGIAIYLSVPTPILSGGTYMSLAAGSAFTCGLRDDGVVVCWGSNLYGAMGRGLVGGLNILALPVLGGHIFRQIAAGNNHMCGLDDKGYPYCWGDNSKGQSGNGTAFSLFTQPTAVLVGGVTATPFARIQAGNDQTCATTANGKAYCWGNLMGTIVPYPTLVSGTGTGPLVFGKGSSAASCAVAP